MTTNYIILRNSSEQASHVSNPNVFHGKKFQIVSSAYDPEEEKIETLDRTISGKADYQVGAIIGSFRGTVRCAHTLQSFQDSTWGTMSDLQSYFHLMNPNATPSNLIYMVDHYGTLTSGFLRGKFAPKPLTTIITGKEAYFFIDIYFEIKDKIA